MAPEHPPKLVIFDSRFEGDQLKGDLHYIEVPVDQRLRVTWDVEHEPKNFKPVGGGVAYVFDTGKLQVLPASTSSLPDDLGGLRYRWSEGLDLGVPWLMFILVLPHGYTLSSAEPRPARAKLFDNRLALYWTLKGDDLGRTGVIGALEKFTGTPSEKLVELNRLCSGEFLPPTASFQIEDTAKQRVRSAKRFVVALSFPGEKRDFIRQVADSLSAVLGQKNVLYDDYLTAELARPNLDVYLGQLYSEHSELLVPFFSADYQRKEWCGLEWRQMRDILKRKGDEHIMPFRFDDTPVTGVLSIDGYVKIGSRTPSEIANFILQRVGELEAAAENQLPVPPSDSTVRSVLSRTATHTVPPAADSGIASLQAETSDKQPPEAETPGKSWNARRWSSVLSTSFWALFVAFIALFMAYGAIFGPKISMVVQDLDWEPRSPKPGETVTFTAKFASTYTVRQFAGGYWPRIREVEGKRSPHTFTETWSIAGAEVKKDRVEVLESGRVTTSQIEKIFDRTGSYPVKFSLDVRRDDNQNEKTRTIWVGDN